jgi:hypothetical protein
MIYIVVGLYVYTALCWCWCPETGTNSIDWAQLSRFLPEGGDRIQSPKRCVLNKNRTMNNVQKHSNCTVEDTNMATDVYIMCG